MNPAARRHPIPIALLPSGPRAPSPRPCRTRRCRCGCGSRRSWAPRATPPPCTSGSATARSSPLPPPDRTPSRRGALGGGLAQHQGEANPRFPFGHPRDPLPGSASGTSWLSGGRPAFSLSSPNIFYSPVFSEKNNDPLPFPASFHSTHACIWPKTHGASSPAAAKDRTPPLCRDRPVSPSSDPPSLSLWFPPFLFTLDAFPPLSPPPTHSREWVAKPLSLSQQKPTPPPLASKG